MRRIQLVDLDGCISDDRWRRGMIQPKGEANNQVRFHLYHSQGWRDPVANLHEIDGEAIPIVLTGRPVEFRWATEQWLLLEAKIRPLFIICRNNHDHRPGVIIKQEMVKWLLSPNIYAIQKEEIVSAIDDREDIVKMYREEFGIDSRIVRIGEEEHVTE